MASWHNFEPSQFFPAPLQRATTAIDAAFGAIGKATNVVEKALRIAAKLAKKASTNPAEDALRTALSQIDTFLEGIVGGTQAHAILIPIRKRVIRRTKGSTALEDFLNPGEPAYAFVQRAQTATGGPGVFFRTLVSSVADAGDTARPQFPDGYAVTGTCVLAGAETLQDLQVPFRLFTTLFAGNQRLPAAGTTMPVVQNLRVTPAALRGGVGVVLRWDPLSPVTNTPLYTQQRVVAQEIFIIRVTKPLTQGWFSWNDLFNAEPLERITDLQDKGDAKVIARLRNHGFVTSYTETSDLLDPKLTYYYTACVRYSIDGEVQPMGPLSNVVRVLRAKPQPSTRQATPPDWFATPSLISMFPPLDQAINQVRLGISRLGSYTTSNSGGQQLLQQTISQIQRLTQEWEATVTSTKEITERLQLLTATSSPAGMYATTITVSSGGMDAWLAELSRRMSDTTDDSRPQLSDQSVVVGLVIVAGAPRLPDLSAIIALLQLFFGNHPRNPLNTTLEELNGNPLVTSATPTATSGFLGYNEALLPSNTPAC